MWAYRMAMIRRPSIRRPSVCPSSTFFKDHFLWNLLANQSQILYLEGTNVFINNQGHMTKMAAMPIYDKNTSKIFFSGTTGPISTKLDMKHQGREYYVF